MKYCMPAEWKPHSRCWMLWPYTPINWRANAAPAQKAFLNVAYAIAKFEPVWMGVPEKLRQQADQSLSTFLESRGKEPPNPHPIHLVTIESDDAWMRDTGPTFVFSTDEQGTKERLVGVNWQFNGYGEKTPSHEMDEKIAAVVCKESNLESVRADFILEGGSIHVDGEGTLITTEQCLLNQNRNPNLSKEQIESRLKKYLGVQTVIWLPRGLVADHDTDGHVDNICCFTKPGEVLLAWSDNIKDEQYEICREALKVLESTVDARNRQINVVKMPIPPPLYYTEEEVKDLELEGAGYPRVPGSRMAASYVNFYIANGGIVYPSFDNETDQIAKKILQQAFPQRTILDVPGREILLGGGNIHCITQQQPLPQL